MHFSVYFVYIYQLLLIDTRIMPNLDDFFLKAQIATALLIIAFILAVTVLRRSLKK